LGIFFKTWAETEKKKDEENPLVAWISIPQPKDYDDFLKLN
jgi:hypothetical protein